MPTLHLTATQRLSRQLRQKHALQHLMTFEEWLTNCWSYFQNHFAHAALTKQRLNAWQERAIWQNIIAQSHREFLRPSQAAQQAQSAWGIWHQWRRSFDELADYTQEDIQAFVNWAKEFENILNENNWISNAQIPAILAELFEQQDQPQQWDQIELCGFDDQFPAFLHLLQICAEKGISITERIPEELTNIDIALTTTETKEQEIKTAANWAYEKYSKSGLKSIAVVIPDLSQRFEEIHHVFAQICGTDFNISSGIPLSQIPVIFDALASLKILLNSGSPAECATLITTPFWKNADSELIQRSQLAIEIRKGAEIALPLFTEAKKHTQKWPKNAKPSQWAFYFSDILVELGWPGERSLESYSYQATQHWLTALNDFAACDGVLGSITAYEALEFLKQITGNSLFQPESQHKPIQVLGLLEAAGLQFDAVWITGLHQNAWPPAPQPNAFLPRDLQRKHNMPHASYARELSFAKSLTARFEHAAPEVIISFAKMDGEMELSVSPLIAHLPERKIAHLPEPKLQQSELETFTDTFGYELEKEKTKGGSALFKYQAECPFKAYAHYRLFARPLEEAELGLDRLEKGNILHAVLEKIWTKLKSQQALLALSQADELNLIEECVENTIEEAKTQIPRHLQPQHWKLERNRLIKLIGIWLKIERERPPFKVEACEEKREITVGKLTVNCKIDRIDTLEYGQHLLIDYKTGKVTTNDWLPEQFLDPQLPLYACSEQQAAGIVFAKINAKEIGFKGIAETKIGIKHIDAVDDWTTLKQIWQQKLNDLADEFQKGFAIVRPENRQICEKCDFEMLCRSHQMEEGAI